MIELLEQSENLVANVSLSFKRYLGQHIDWKNQLIGIKGARGTGKTTMLLQWLKEAGLGPQAAYLSLDDLYFSQNSLLATAKDFYKQGGQVLVLDEVHKYPGWAREIKNLYDSHPTLQIIFTGSSIIDIARQEGDLSRRALMYELPGMSFREYLAFQGIVEVTPFTLQQLLSGKEDFRKVFPSGFRPLEHFQAYLAQGYYPFFKESPGSYHKRIQQLVRTIVEYDMAELRGFDIRNAKKLLQLLYIIAQQVPFKPNISSLSQKSNIHRNSLNNYLYFLEEARLIGLLYPAGISVATLQKPEKIYMDNTNLLFALSAEKPDKDSLREVYFHSQLKVAHRLAQPKSGDFVVDETYTFEVGGKGKGMAQISGTANSWVVKDDLEYPVGNALPLWLFGFLY